MWSEHGRARLTAKIKYEPDDVELPLQIGNPRRRDLHDLKEG